MVTASKPGQHFCHSASNSSSAHRQGAAKEIDGWDAEKVARMMAMDGEAVGERHIRIWMATISIRLVHTQEANLGHREECQKGM